MPGCAFCRTSVWKGATEEPRRMFFPENYKLQKPWELICGAALRASGAPALNRHIPSTPVSIQRYEHGVGKLLLQLECRRQNVLLLPVCLVHPLFTKHRNHQGFAQSTAINWPTFIELSLHRWLSMRFLASLLKKLLYFIFLLLYKNSMV